MAARWEIVGDIAEAHTLPGWVYSDPQIFAEARDKIFARSWQLVGDIDRVREPGSVFPTRLLEGCLDEPLLLTRAADGELHCISNVCTHRGNLVCDSAGTLRSLKCRYHGRRFGHDGKFVAMPEFEEARGFPTAADDLPAVPLGRWKKFLFAALAPRHPLEELVASMEARVGWLPVDAAVLDPTRCKDYDVAANWALYCDNYLEGFHIPYVHAGLNRVIDYGDYKTELLAHGSLQVGRATKEEHAFTLPRSSPDHGQNIAAYYFWLFPNTMLNFYPWGVSINRVKPVAPDRSTVSYLTYVWDATKLDRGAGSGLDEVEHEDEEVVESVQRGVRSRLYARGRYSPTRETGVHHFHRMLTAQLAEP
jgi:choline monooxygenase